MTSQNLEVEAQPEHSRAVVLSIIVAAQLIVSLDFSLVSVAIPSIERGLGIGPAASQWVLTADVIAYAGFLIVGGRLSDAYGQKFALTYGLALFMLGSLVSAFAPGLAVLIAARVVQGLGAALTFPATVSLLARTFPEGAERFRALTITTGIVAVAVPLGTIIAGGLVTRFGWNAALVLNIPVCFLILCALPWTLSNPSPTIEPRARIPYVSAAVLAIATGFLIQAALGTVARDEGTRTIALYALPCGLVITALFIVMQKHSPTPLISLALLRNRQLAICILVTATLVMAGKGMIILSNISFQQGLHFSPLKASLALLPMSVASLLLIPLTPKIGGLLLPHPKSTLIGAFILMGTIHFVLSTIPGSAATVALLVLLFVQPFFSVTGTNVGVGEMLKNAAPKDHGVAAAMLYTAVQIIGGLGFSLMIAAADRSPDIVDDFSRFTPSFRLAAFGCVVGLVITGLFFRSDKRA